MANYLKHGVGMSRQHDEAMDIAKPLTPRSERPRRTWGSLSMSLQTAQGLCPKGRCIRHDGHRGDCYPKEDR